MKKCKIVSFRLSDVQTIFGLDLSINETYEFVQHQDNPRFALVSINKRVLPIYKHWLEEKGEDGNWFQMAPNPFRFT